MAQVIFDENKRNDFKNYLLDSTIYGDNKTNVEKSINDATQGLVNQWDKYTKYNSEQRFTEKNIKESETYKKLTTSPIDPAVTYKLNYVFTTNATNDQKKRILDLYSTNNINTKVETFDGKIKFN
jgi:hypothetical protein